LCRTLNGLCASHNRTAAALHVLPRKVCLRYASPEREPPLGARDASDAADPDDAEETG